LKVEIELINPVYLDKFATLSYIEQMVVIAVNYCGKSWGEICKQFNFSRRHVIRLYDRAISVLANDKTL